MELDIATNWENKILIMELKGRLDTNSSTKFEQTIEETINPDVNNMIIDCSDLEYICSRGLGLIIHAAKMLKSNQGELVLCSMEDYIEEVFEISGFNKFLKIVVSKEEAINSF